MAMQVVAGPRSPALAKALAAELDADLVEAETKRFPDGEAYLRVAEDLSGDDVVLVQSTLGDEAWVELLLLQDAVASWEPATAVAVVPYLGYARQDQRFEPGEALSVQALAKAAGLAGQPVVTVDPHKPLVMDFFDVPCEAVTAMPALADPLAEEGCDFVLAPDEGAMEMAKRVAAELGCDVDHVIKERISGDEVHIEAKDLDVEGRTVAVVDDIISTGGTMANAARALDDQGADRVVCAGVHGVFAGTALKRLADAGVDRTLVTDTIEGPQSAATVAPVVAPAVRKLLG